MHPKKIIKLDSLQQTLFGLLGQQIRLTLTTKSVTADDGDLDNDSSPEPTKQQTKKKSLLCITVQSKQTKCLSLIMYHRYLIICHKK